MNNVGYYNLLKESIGGYKIEEQKKTYKNIANKLYKYCILE